MDTNPPASTADLVAQVLGQLLRQPEPLRDAAVVAAGATAGVLAGQVLFQGLSDAPQADPTDLADGDDLLGSFGLL